MKLTCGEGGSPGPGAHSRASVLAAFGGVAVVVAATSAVIRVMRLFGEGPFEVPAIRLVLAGFVAGSALLTRAVGPHRSALARAFWAGVGGTATCLLVSTTWDPADMLDPIWRSRGALAWYAECAKTLLAPVLGCVVGLAMVRGGLRNERAV